MSEKALKCCPFCGCAMTVRSNRDWHRIDGDHDDDCIFDEEVTMVPATDKHLAEAIAAWNRRSQPEGWKLVPIESTGKMDDAGKAALPDDCQYTDAERCYRAMIEAAPQPPEA